MPSTGNPIDRMPASHGGAPASYTEFGPPDSTMPTGSSFRICSIPAVHGRIALKTFCSRIRRAISCVYCPPKSSTTMPPRSLIHTSSDYKIHEFIWNGDDFDHALAVQKLLDFRISQSAFAQFLLAQPRFHHHLCLHPAIYLHRNFDLIFSSQLGIEFWPGCVRQHCVRV